MRWDGSFWVLGLAILATCVGATGLAAQLPDDLDELSDAALYEAACANCHGQDGRGLDRALVGFEEALPDFTDCDFAAREPESDWIAIGHEGGPVRGFSMMMPAFGEALSVEQVARVVRHIKSLCTDPSWPRGKLNLPRALLAEKAFPEDEWVTEVGASLDGDGAVDGAFVWEQRFGPRSQLEVVIPYGWAELPDAGGGAGATDWVSGFGDLVLGVKHTFYHSSDAGRIFALGAEVVLPTGDETKGLGADGTKAEAFASFGQILPSDAFVQVQLGGEKPFYDGGENEAFARVVLGRTFTSGRWGRSWTPMVELQAKRELEGGVPTPLDIVPQMQFSLNTRQHVLANIGVLIPATETSGRSVRLLAYVLLDWFDGGFFEGW
ncbi:MAG: c-type cytochrome [Gemmatimonadota bacterium]|nr:c-type cytochrome [Gemmatimonadota bacterium]